MSEQNQIPTTKICRVDILIVTYGKLKAPGNTLHTVSRDELNANQGYYVLAWHQMVQLIIFHPCMIKIQIREGVIGRVYAERHV